MAVFVPTTNDWGLSVELPPEIIARYDTVDTNAHITNYEYAINVTGEVTNSVTIKWYKCVDGSVTNEWHWDTVTNTCTTLTTGIEYPAIGHARWADSCDDYIFRPQQIPVGERLRQIMRDRIAPTIITRRRPMQRVHDMREIRARETLKRILGEEKFRTFLSKGFVSVRAKSGMVYQIFPGHGITQVFNCGKLVERLCVVLQGGFPETDSLIMRYLMILDNEEKFKSHAVKHGINTSMITTRNSDQRQLNEIFKDLKGKKVA